MNIPACLAVANQDTSLDRRNMNDVFLARALHVLAVVIWIGGVAMVTTVILPAIRCGDLGNDRLKAFETIERRFIWHARIAVLAVGLSGLYMVYRLSLWERFTFVSFWWMHAMVLVWLIFTFALFFAEPFILHRHFHAWARRQPESAFAWLQRAHWLLLGLALVTVFGAAAGSHGWVPF